VIWLSIVSRIEFYKSFSNDLILSMQKRAIKNYGSGSLTSTSVFCLFVNLFSLLRDSYWFIVLFYSIDLDLVSYLLFPTSSFTLFIFFLASVMILIIFPSLKDASGFALNSSLSLASVKVKLKSLVASFKRSYSSSSTISEWSWLSLFGPTSSELSSD